MIWEPLKESPASSFQNRTSKFSHGILVFPNRLVLVLHHITSTLDPCLALRRDDPVRNCSIWAYEHVPVADPLQLYGALSPYCAQLIEMDHLVKGTCLQKLPAEGCYIIQQVDPSERKAQSHTHATGRHSSFQASACAPSIWPAAASPTGIQPRNPNFTQFDEHLASERMWILLCKFECIFCDSTFKLKSATAQHLLL